MSSFFLLRTHWSPDAEGIDGEPDGTVAGCRCEGFRQRDGRCQHCLLDGKQNMAHLHCVASATFCCKSHPLMVSLCLISLPSICSRATPEHIPIGRLESAHATQHQTEPAVAVCSARAFGAPAASTQKLPNFWAPTRA